MDDDDKTFRAGYIAIWLIVVVVEVVCSVCVMD